MKKKGNKYAFWKNSLENCSKITANETISKLVADYFSHYLNFCKIFYSIFFWFLIKCVKTKLIAKQLT